MLQSRKEFKEVDCGATIPETEKTYILSALPTFAQSGLLP